MALTDTKIEIFDRIPLIACSGGYDIWVLSTSSQKSNISWPQQPPIEKVLKFNMTIHDSTKKIFFPKHQNKAELKNLDDSEVLSSDFQTLEPQQPQ